MGWNYKLYELAYTKICEPIISQHSQMLKSLISRVKSQKTKSHTQKQQEHLQKQTQQVQIIEPAQLLRQINLGPQTIVQCHFDKIRYLALESFPQIYNKILACPISVFNKLPYAKRKVKQIDLRNHSFPEYLVPLKSLLEKELPTYNHVLINVYPPGVGIMPHFDGPQYRSKVVVLSLGGPAIISFTDSYSNSNKIAKLLLEDKSIHIFEAQAYQNMLHGIENFDVESIFLNLNRNQQGSIIIRKVSVSNFELTNLCKFLLQKLQNNKQNNAIEQIDMSDWLPSAYFLPIHNNDEFNAKIEIIKTQRISITLRQKFY